MKYFANNLWSYSEATLHVGIGSHVSVRADILVDFIRHSTDDNLHEACVADPGKNVTSRLFDIIAHGVNRRPRNQHHDSFLCLIIECPRIALLCHRHYYYVAGTGNELFTHGILRPVCHGFT